jgi:hypothetical protein
MNNQLKIKASIKIQSIWRSYRTRNLRSYMQVKKCDDCNIYSKLYPLSKSELESNVFTCWNCNDIPHCPTVTCLVDDNDTEGIKYMKQLYMNKKNDIARTPTATCIIDNNDVEGMRYMEKIYTNNIFDKEFLDDNKNDSSDFGEYHQAGMTF